MFKMWHKYNFVVISFNIFLFVTCSGNNTTLILVQNVNNKLLNHF